MKRGVFVIASLLALCAAIPAAATITWSVNTVGADTIYSYTYTNTEDPGEIVAGVHAYAPVDASLVSAGVSDAGWVFGTALDYSGALDIYWLTNSPATYGLSGGETVNVSFKTAASVATVYAYVLQDFDIGNWGYDTENSYGTLTMFGSVPVPQGTGTPEPASCVAMLLGCGWLAVRRRR